MIAEVALTGNIESTATDMTRFMHIKHWLRCRTSEPLLVLALNRFTEIMTPIR